MSRRAALLLLALVGAFFTAGLAWLFRMRLSGGDIYPAYSSLRADPLGTRAFYEALEEQPELRVERWMKPLSTLSPEPCTLILAGMSRSAWDGLATQDAQALDAIAVAGGRVVVVFAAELEPEISTAPTKFETASKEKRDQEKAKRIAELPDRLKPADWEGRWNLNLGRSLILDRVPGAIRRPDAPAPLPLTVPWKSDVYVDLKSGGFWRTLYTRGASPVVVERLRGRGSIVIATDAFFLSNEAMADRRFPALLSWVVGSQRSVIFVESHLGLTEQLGVAALARRYGLAGCFFVLVLAFGLWVWSRMALFVPSAPAAEHLSLSYHQTAGLEALLRRAVPPKQLLAACVQEWKLSARAADADRLESALAAAPADVSPVEHYNALVCALKKRF